MKNKAGRVVSTKRSANAKKGKIAKWGKAVVAARKALKISEFPLEKKVIKFQVD